MQRTITPIDNTLYIEREYNSEIIEDTINKSVTAQKAWAKKSVKERIELLANFVEDFLSRKEIIAEELCRQIGRPIAHAAGELSGFAHSANPFSIKTKPNNTIHFNSIEGGGYMILCSSLGGTLRGLGVIWVSCWAKFEGLSSTFQALMDLFGGPGGYVNPFGLQELPWRCKFRSCLPGYL